MYDTVTTVVVDSVAVTDTLVIDVVLTGPGPDKLTNRLKVYPNPARDHLYIHTGDHLAMEGYRLKIIDQLGVTLFETHVEEQFYELNLSDWSGHGLYYIQVIDDAGNISDIRKIILQ